MFGRSNFRSFYFRAVGRLNPHMKNHEIDWAGEDFFVMQSWKWGHFFLSRSHLVVGKSNLDELKTLFFLEFQNTFFSTFKCLVVCLKFIFWFKLIVPFLWHFQLVSILGIINTSSNLIFCSTARHIVLYRLDTRLESRFFLLKTIFDTFLYKSFFVQTETDTR